jgi:hypothetical protein
MWRRACQVGFSRTGRGATGSGQILAHPRRQACIAAFLFNRT